METGGCGLIVHNRVGVYLTMNVHIQNCYVCFYTNFANFCFAKNYEWFEKPYQKTGKSVSSGIQTPAPRNFSTHFSVFGYPDETLILVFDVLLKCYRIRWI